MRRWLEWVPALLFVLSLCLAAFTYGAVVVGTHIRPYKRLRSLAEAASASYEKYSYLLASQFKSKQHERLNNLWFPAPEAGQGVVVNQATDDALILFSDCTSSARLIDRAGKTVHQWALPFYSAFPDPAQLIDRVPEEQIYWRNVVVEPDGKLTAIYEGLNQSPYGGGLVQLDKASQLKWAAPINANHDLVTNARGELLVLEHKYEGGRIEDYLDVLSPADGAVQSKFSLYEAFHGSPYRYLLPDEPTGDYLHTNSVLELDAAWERECSLGKAGDLLFSHNHLSILSLVDGKTHRVKWALSGVSKGLHDPDLLPGCRIGFFDNRGGRERGESSLSSRVLIYDTKSGEVSVRYQDPDHFLTISRGSLEWLPNDHVFITESNSGRLFEVDAQSNTVWKYIHDRRDADSICVVNEAKVLRREQVPFLGSL